MAVSEPDPSALEVKLAPTDTMDRDPSSYEPPMHDGEAFNPAPLDQAIPPIPDINGHTKDPDAQPSMTNGDSISHPLPNVSQSMQETSLSFPVSGETGSSLRISGETNDVLLPSSEHSAPDDLVDQPTVKLDQSAIDPSPAVVQQPISDLREGTQPVNQEQIAEIKEQKQQQDFVSDPEMANGLGLGATDAALQASVSEPKTEFTVSTPPLESRSDIEASAAPVAGPDLTTQDIADISEAAEKTPETAPANTTDHASILLSTGAAPEAPRDPAPSPVRPEQTPPRTTIHETPLNDQAMPDAPPSPAKVAREREDDDLDSGPVSKRSKIEDDASAAPEFKVPERPAVNAEVNGVPTGEPQTTAPSMTKPQHKHLLKVIGNIKRIQASAMFRLPVDYVALNLPRYPEVITKPMDLKTLEENLRADKYRSVDACVADFNQIIENAKTFNGPDHPVTQHGYSMKASFDKAMETLPGPEVTEPTANNRKKKAPEPAPVKVAPPRRESRSSLPGSARSPISAGSPQTFALGPEGVPLIRRDSTFGDGRPKREIHRPAPRDLPYANQKPKKKKFQWELKFCEKVLAELSKPKYAGYSYPFMTPVDPVALNIPSYHSIIKKPMDFGTVKQKLDRGEYENAKEFEADARLVFQNCYKFNPPGDVINQTGHSFEEIFDGEWAKKREWVEANTPASGPQSPGSSPEPEDSEDEDDEDDGEEEEQSELSKLQQQILAMSRQVELITQKKKSPPAPSKKANKPAKPARKDTKKAAPAPAKADKKAASRPAKKEKIPYVTWEQKQDISNRINSLSETKMATALKIIRDNMPSLKGIESDELELDIDELSNEVLYKLLVFVRKHAPRPDDSPTRPVASSSTAAPTRKKNKPMSKHEQEARIQQVQNSLSGFQGSPTSQSHEPSHEAEASDEDGDSDSSEEE